MFGCKQIFRYDHDQIQTTLLNIGMDPVNGGCDVTGCGEVSLMFPQRLENENGHGKFIEYGKSVKVMEFDQFCPRIKTKLCFL